MPVAILLTDGIALDGTNQEPLYLQSGLFMREGIESFPRDISLALLVGQAPERFAIHVGERIVILAPIYYPFHGKSTNLI